MGPKVKKILSILLYSLIVVAVIGGLYFLSTFLINKFNLFKGKAGLSVEALYGGGKVYRDGDLLGSIPFSSEEVSSGEHTIKVENDSNSYEVSLNFLPGTQVVVNRDLGVSETFSSGQNFWLEQDSSGTVLSIVSNPANASVYIDNTEVGSAPYSTDTLSEGEYDLRVEYSGYEAQNARINVKSGYKLNVMMDLFPMPVPSKIEAFEDSDDLYNVSSDNLSVTFDPSMWVKAILYWGETRGINLAGLGLNKEAVFDYFIDYKGEVYDKSGTLLDHPDEYASKLADAEKGAYLGRVSDGDGLTEQAKEAYEAVSGGIIAGKTATIKPTGVGWLRVRSMPGLDGTEIAKVDVGDTFTVLEEDTGWVKIKVSDTIEGWVSVDYVELSE